MWSRRPNRNVPLHPIHRWSLPAIKLLLLAAIILPALWELRGLLQKQTALLDFLKLLAYWAILLPGAFILSRKPVKKFIRAVFNLPAGQEKLLLRHTKHPLYPAITLREGGQQVTVQGDETYISHVSHVGGAALISLYNDTAVLLERAGRFSRVLLGPTAAYLERFERIYQAIDLRPQHGATTVKAMSKEGLPVTCRVEIDFQITPQGRPTEEIPYPVSSEAVFQAATVTQVRHAANHTVTTRDWAARAVSSIGGTLRTMLAQHPLDHLVPAQITTPGQPPSAEGPEQPDLQTELFNRLRPKLTALGVQLNRVHLGTIEVDEAISRQWADIWQAGWRQWATELLGEGRAERLQYLDKIRTETQVEFLNAVAREIQQLDDNGIPISDSLIALQFIDALRQMEQPLTQQDKVYFPAQAWNALEQLRRIIVRRDDGPEINFLT